MKTDGHTRRKFEPKLDTYYLETQFFSHWAMKLHTERPNKYRRTKNLYYFPKFLESTHTEIASGKLRFRQQKPIILILSIERLETAPTYDW